MPLDPHTSHGRAQIAASTNNYLCLMVSNKQQMNQEKVKKN